MKIDINFYTFLTVKIWYKQLQSFSLNLINNLQTNSFTIQLYILRPDENLLCFFLFTFWMSINQNNLILSIFFLINQKQLQSYKSMI